MKIAAHDTSTLSYLRALLWLNVKAMFARPTLTATTAAMMIGNNLILFMIWLIYFGKFSSIRGWTLEDMSLILGIVAWAGGLAFVVTGGVRDLARTIVNGGLDVHLGRPRHPLPSLLICRSIPAGLGDMISAPIFWLGFGHRSIADLPMLLLVSTCAAVVISATLTVTQCLVFWFPRALSFCEDLFNMILMVSFYPQHVYGFMARLVLFTVFPTAFMAFVPAYAVREGDWWIALAMIGAAAVYSAIAVAVFNRGLRSYTSGNRLLELR